MVNKKEFNPKVQWAKFIGVLVLYLLFLYWVESWWGLLVIPFIFDVYITKKIKWQWWKESERPVKFVMSWIDALVFALVAVYFINQFFFQNYVIPSSSLEKSLLTGDYLFVSKVSYGPRIPQTPLTMPLTQHTLPVVECKSYIDWPHWVRWNSTILSCSTSLQVIRSVLPRSIRPTTITRCVMVSAISCIRTVQIPVRCLQKNVSSISRPSTRQVVTNCGGTRPSTVRSSRVLQTVGRTM